MKFYFYYFYEIPVNIFPLLHYMSARKQVFVRCPTSVALSGFDLVWFELYVLLGPSSSSTERCSFFVGSS